MLRKLYKHLRYLGIIPHLSNQLQEIRRELELLRASMGQAQESLNNSLPSLRLADHEFRVFSQWGQDGILQYLIRNIKIKETSFIEFGVESYRESNTRFLLYNNNWRGLIFDGNTENISHVKHSELYWRYSLQAVCTFVTPSNIDSLITGNGFTGEAGLLVVDIDGQDYWVWKNITSISPAIVVVEYNFRFGPDRAVTVPLNEKFVRSEAHHSCLYFGASLAALAKLGGEKGYSLVGCNSHGNDAFFVRNDLMPDGWKALTVREAYVQGRFRESRDAHGHLTFCTPEAEAKIIADLPLVEV